MRQARRAFSICMALWIAMSVGFAMAGCGADLGGREGSPSREGSAAEQGGEEASQESGSEEAPDFGDKGDGSWGEGSGSTEAPKETAEYAPSEEEESGNLTFSLTGAPYGLPEEVMEQIAQINQGVPPSDVLGDVVPEGYYALVATYTVIAQDRETGEESTGSGKLTLYVPNLMEGLEDVTVLCYDNGESQWKLLPVKSKDPEKKQLSVMLSGSATLTVIYKRQT